MTERRVIRQNRALAHVAIVDSRYSPGWWDSDPAQPSQLRQAASKWHPQLCVIHDHEGKREFVAFGGMAGMSAALDRLLGPEIGSKDALDRLLFASNRAILTILPDDPHDALDQFILVFLQNLARANLGCGFDAIQAKIKLEAIRQMPYGEIRTAASESPDYAQFLMALEACRAC